MLNYFKESPKFKKIIEKLVMGTQLSTPFNVALENVADNVNILLALSLFKKINQTVVLVCSNIYYANRTYEQFLNLLSPNEVSFFPGEEHVASELVASSSAFRLARMQTIVRILEDVPQIIITNTEGVLRNIMSKERIQKAILTFKVGDNINRNDMIDMLITRGYKKVSLIEAQGTFSVRGSIIDIYTTNNNEPYRINFFDNEIETIKTFDVETQISNNFLNNITIYPVYEMHYESNMIEVIKKEVLKDNPLSEKVKRDFELLEQYQNLDQLYVYLPYIDSNYQNILSTISKKIVIYNNFNAILEKEKQNIFEMGEYFEKVNFIGKTDFIPSIMQIIPINKVNLFTSSFNDKPPNISVNLNLDLKTSNNFDYNNNLKNLIEDLKLNTNRTYIITHQTETRKQYFIDLLKTNDVLFVEIKDFTSYQSQKINIILSADAFGFIDYENNLEIITPFEYAGGKITKHHKYQSIYKESIKIYSKEEINIGDYVVHRDYGIGRYLGIKTIQLKDIKNDYLWIEYSQDSKLYIPVENIYVLEKYLGSKDKIPKLSKLGSKEWEKKKARIKERVAETAKMLIKIQAQRELMKGFKYSKDSYDQKQFELDFSFIETKDQLKAIEELKSDLESSRPVDRLLCGDVGFGKTEVAMRGAFKVVEAGKQVAYMAPTTVLARQHYHTFKERFEKYGIRVELLSRFVDRNTAFHTIEGLKKGYVDIVIGTHRLLSKDIVFKDLGFLIIDEEHRFGVEHKERIKEMKANVDVLSLSATPIPRTLQMALTGVRDLSLIETPPMNRLSVQTYVLESNDSVIREAINRELGRKGQVFYLMNRINKLDQIARKIRRLVPEAKVGIIHGKMPKEEIEDVLNAFIDKRYDVLICTTIIETGIDIPNANTVIIERADILGLSQLYQIRGRVGRGDRIAYAYLMYDKDLVMTETAHKRLETIKEFTALGSGYKIAMRDLSIRGAGDILGSEQSGFIDAIGIDLYLKMLNEAIEAEKGIVKEDEIPINLDIGISKHIDEQYVSDDVIRIDMHQAINKIRSIEEANKLREEFTDRFGKLDDEIDIYIEGKYLSYLLKSKGVASYKESGQIVEFHFDVQKSNMISYEQLQKIQSLTDLHLNFEYKHRKIFVKVYLKDSDKQKNHQNFHYKLTKILENI